jgi:parvulin-like peptidyl-prolyl isomerase
MGNQVRAGAAFGEVARAMSDGPTASDGGTRNWTHKGSLVCEELDRALFGLPVGQLSPIIESADGLHIIRVIERDPGGRVPFVEAQAEIRPKLRQQRASERLQNYIAGLRQEIPVWTVFDQQGEDQQMSGREGNPRH